MKFKLLLFPVLFVLKKLIKKILKNPALKRYIADKINDKIDIKNLNEKEEEELFTAIIDAFIAFTDDYL